MTEAEIKASPPGVPGAVTEPALVRGDDITFAGDAGTAVGGYLARPAATGSHPGMIVIHEAYGVNDHIRDVANRIAALGYVALAVDLYSREGGAPALGDMQAVMARVLSLPDERALGDLEGAADYLRGREDVTGKVGCIGFCMGGRYTLLFACASDRLDAAVDCWGGFIDRSTPDQIATPARPTPPLALARRLHCPLMAAIGAQDENPSPANGEQLRGALSDSPHETQVDVYEGAGHAFFADYRPNYRPAAAAQLWERVVPFLERHLQRG
jgi:carboxymethylenebutenolidase